MLVGEGGGAVLARVEAPAGAGHGRLGIDARAALDIGMLTVPLEAEERRVGQGGTDPAFGMDRARDDRTSVAARHEELDWMSAAVQRREFGTGGVEIEECG